MDNETNILDLLGKRKGVESIVQRMASLSPMEYDQQREKCAKDAGVRVSTLDREVRKAREERDAADSADQLLSVVEEIEPWESAVDGCTLLDEMAATLERHVHLPTGARDALAVWCVGSFALEAFTLWPKVLITSPEKRCGKTTLLDVMESLSCRALAVSNISPSAIFRSIELWRPTLLIDEADRFVVDNPELNGVINAGHRRRTARVVRTEKVGDSFEPRSFSVWAPMVVAGIGNQQSTLHDRSIHIEMERKLPDERVDRMPVDFYERMQTVRRKCLRWAGDNIVRLKERYAGIPNYGNDRAQDNWEPLARIADAVGGDWPDRIRKSYRLFSARDSADDDAGVLLLRDIQKILKERMCSKISSADLVDALTAIEDSPWFEWKRGKPLTQNSLSRLLRPFGIRPSTIRIGGSTPKGYDALKFESAFHRYLSSTVALQTATPPHPSNGAGCSDFQSATQQDDVALSKSRKPSNGAGCGGVAVQNDTTGKKGGEL